MIFIQQEVGTYDLSLGTEIFFVEKVQDGVYVTTERVVC